MATEKTGSFQSAKFDSFMEHKGLTDPVREDSLIKKPKKEAFYQRRKYACRLLDFAVTDNYSERKEINAINIHGHK